MRTITIIIVLLTLTVAAGSSMADSWSVFGQRTERGSGDVTTETITATDFDRIRLKCSADVTVTFGDAYRVTVTTDDNLQDNIIVEVASRRTLIIDSEDSYSTRRGVRVEITMPTLNLLEVDGSGDVEIAGLNSETLEIDLGGSGDVAFDGSVKDLQVTIAGSGSVTAHDVTADNIRIETAGSGDVELRGKTIALNCIIEGSGDIDAVRLQANDVTAEVHGSGDISVFAQESFDGAVYGSGGIDFYGEPKDVNRHVAGSGDIRRRH